MYVGDTTAESRANWITALDRFGGVESEDRHSRSQEAGRAGHPRGYRALKRYLTDFSRLRDATSSDRELYDAMTDLYPDWVSHQAWLMFGFS
jgi:hypothetical protein